MVAAGMGLMATAAVAEEVTLSTYYPSPRGVYDELRTLDNTFLAIQQGNVGVGTVEPHERLEVNGGLRLNPLEARRPACTVERRGTLWYERDVKLESGNGHVDRLLFCAKVLDRYQWVMVVGQ